LPPLALGGTCSMVHVYIGCDCIGARMRFESNLVGPTVCANLIVTYDQFSYP